ncbi:hypothetical protein DMN91_011430, partial [Ooceraea biroi]
MVENTGTIWFGRLVWVSGDQPRKFWYVSAQRENVWTPRVF